MRQGESLANNRLARAHLISKNAAPRTTGSDHGAAPVCRIERQGEQPIAVSPDHRAWVETSATQLFKRGIISRAMMSICSLSYLYGTKMSFCVPTARCALSCSTHSSTVPMMALSLVDSLQAAKAHSFVSHSIIGPSTACRDFPIMIGSCEALRSLSGSLPPSLAKSRILAQDFAKLSGR